MNDQKETMKKKQNTILSLSLLCLIIGIAGLFNGNQSTFIVFIPLTIAGGILLAIFFVRSLKED